MDCCSMWYLASLIHLKVVGGDNSDKVCDNITNVSKFQATDTNVDHFGTADKNECG